MVAIVIFGLLGAGLLFLLLARWGGNPARLRARQAERRAARAAGPTGARPAMDEAHFRALVVDQSGDDQSNNLEHRTWGLPGR